MLDGRPIGFLHADRKTTVAEEDVADLTAFALCLVVVYERAVLRQRLREQRQEMRQVAGWADARTSELGDRSVTLGDDAAPRQPAIASPSPGDNALRDLLTRREVEVLELMVRGDTNAGIARELVVSEGTVKFHVKATSRYLRLTLSHPDAGR